MSLPRGSQHCRPGPFQRALSPGVVSSSPACVRQSSAELSTGPLQISGSLSLHAALLSLVLGPANSSHAGLGASAPLSLGHLRGSAGTAPLLLPLATLSKQSAGPIRGPPHLSPVSRDNFPSMTDVRPLKLLSRIFCDFCCCCWLLFQAMG